MECRQCATREFKSEPGRIAPSSNGPPPLPASAKPKWQFRGLTPREMELDLVTLVTCRTLMDADMIVGQLEAAGISAFIPDEFLSQVIAWNVNTYGYVRVQVSPKDYESAKAFLMATPGEAGSGAASDAETGDTFGGAGAEGK